MSDLGSIGRLAGQFSEAIVPTQSGATIPWGGTGTRSQHTVGEVTPTDYQSVIPWSASHFSRHYLGGPPEVIPPEPDPRPVLNLAPTWSEPVELRLDIPTAKYRALAGAEVRRALGSTLRLRMRWRSLVSAARMATMRNQLQDTGDLAWLVPLWPLMVAGADAATARIGGAYWAAWNDLDAEDAVTFTDPADCAGYDWAAPVMVARLEVDPQTQGPEWVLVSFDAEEDSEASEAITAEAVTWDEGPALPDATTPVVFPWTAYWQRPATAGHAERVVTRRRLGQLRTRATEDYGAPSERPLDADVFLHEEEEVAGFLRWWMDRAGDVEAHYVGTVTDAIALTDDAEIGDTVLDVDDVASLGINRYLRLADVDDVEWARISAVGETTVTLTAALATDWPAGNTKLALHMLARHARSEVELRFAKPWSAVARLAWREVPAEYTPGSGETRGTTLGAIAPPAYLYQITLDYIGSTDVIRLTDYESALTADGDEWTPFAIQHGELLQTLRMDRDNLSVRMRYRSDILGLCLPGRHDAVIRLTIWRCEVAGGAGSNLVLMFTGEVVGANASGAWVDLACAGASSLFDRPVPRRLMQRGCNHAVYSSQCGVDVSDWTWSAAVVSADGSELSVENLTKAGGNPAVWGWTGYFAAGYLERASDGTRRLIAASDEKDFLDRVVLRLGSAPLTEFEAGETVYLIPGCDGTPETCDAYHAVDNPLGKFDNFTRFGGFPALPQKPPQFTPLKTDDSATGKK